MPVPSNQEARRRILQQARTGTRPDPHSADYVDAFGAVESVTEIRKYYESQKSDGGFFQMISTSWGNRK